MQHDGARRNGTIAAVVAVVLVAGAGGWWAWRNATAGAAYAGFASGNGRIEAVEIDVAAKSAGRIQQILVQEGSLVSAGAPLAKIDDRQLQAARAQAVAERKRAALAVETAQSGVAQAEATKRAADATIEQAQASYDAAQKQFERTQKLTASSTASVATLDVDRANALGAKAAIAAAEAQSAAAAAGVNTAQSAVVSAEAAVEAADAAIAAIDVQISDSTLTSPRDGRVQYLVAQEGEIVAAGGRVMNLADLGDVYMTIFLPTAQAGRIGLGTPARIILDAAPDYVIPGKVSYVADVAQFTPKTVETEIEREKLMFRVKVSIDPALLKKYADYVKTGLPGAAWVQLDPQAAWPAALSGKLLQ